MGDSVRFVSKPLPRTPSKIYCVVLPVDLIASAAGYSDRSIDSLTEVGCRGLVVEALGNGSLPEDTVHRLKNAVRHNIPVVITTRCFSGGVFNPESLNELGFVTTNLSGAKARIKLMLALSLTNDVYDIAKIFTQNP